MNYFDHEYISASDLKSFLKKTQGGRQEPENLQEIFALGTLIHATILEPHLIDEEMKEEHLDLARQMRKTFFKDEMCRMVMMRSDFEREQEFYNPDVIVGNMKYHGRCKADGASKGISLLLELKGLSLTTQKAFEESIDHLNYDLACAHYILTSGLNTMMLVGISKTKPDRLFKKIVKKHDETYLVGEEKLIQTLRQLQQFSPEDVQTISRMKWNSLTHDI